MNGAGEDQPSRSVREANILGLWWGVLRTPGETLERLESGGVRASLGIAAASFALWATLRYGLYHAIMLLILPAPSGPESHARYVRGAVQELVAYSLGLVLFLALLALTAATLQGVLRIASSERRAFAPLLTVMCASSAPIPLLAFTIWAALLVVPWVVAIALIGFRRTVGSDWLESILLVGLAATIIYTGSLVVGHAGRALARSLGAL